MSLHRSRLGLALAASSLLLPAWAGWRAGPQADALLAVLNKSDATVSFLDPTRGEVLATLAVGDGPHEAATSPDGALLVVCNYGGRAAGSTLSVIDAERRAVARTIELGHHRPHGVLFTPGGELVVVTAEAERKLLLVDPHAGKVEAAIDTGQDVSHMVALARGGGLALVANIRSGTVSVIDLARRERVKVIETGAGAEGIATAPSGREVWVTNRSADTLSVIDVETLEVVATLECAKFPIRVAFTPDGRHALVSCMMSAEVVVFDADARKELRRIPMLEEVVDTEGRLFADARGAAPVGILVEPSGRRAYVANTNADVITILDLEDWRVAGRLRAGREPDGMAWIPAREGGSEEEE